MADLLAPILARWRSAAPTFSALEAGEQLEHLLAVPAIRSILLPLPPTNHFPCFDCGETWPVSWICADDGIHHAYIHCRDCGINEVPLELLQRWEIDATALLVAAFAPVRQTLQVHLPGLLWQIGKAKWAGRVREVWFLRCCLREHAVSITHALQARPTAIVFCPTESTVTYWRENVPNLPNLLLALDSALSLSESGFEFDAEYVEGRIADVCFGQPKVKAPRRRAKRRGSRDPNIELLSRELIAHLRAAKDHAKTTKAATGVAELLPRPYQNALAKKLKIDPSAVHRCLHDEKAKILRIYWTMARDLDAILKFERPLRKGRRR